MTTLISNETLHGSFVRLENLEEHHFEGLQKVVEKDDKRIFVNSHLGGSFKAYFELALSRCSEIHAPFVVREQATDNYVGMSRLYSSAIQHRICEIGYTWYAPDFWGGPANPEAKLLLMQHVFETCNLRRVQFSTDVRNLHSQAAIKKLGATLEGVLRCNRILPDGSRRDSPIFSIIDTEWPDVRLKLLQRLEKFKP
jgi:RimJ/RimL family protein N-acetyltransferase